MDGTARAGATPPPAIVLVRPQEEGNVGAVARAMANTGFARLLVVEPAVALGATARKFAVHAGEILDRAQRHPDLPTALAGFRRVVATTAARDRVWPTARVTARELPLRLAGDPAGTPTALVFGPESSGLTNEELATASLLVTIPSAPEQPTLNLAQAVLVVCYELFVAGAGAGSAPDGETLASASEIDGFEAQLGELLARSGFARDSTARGVERDLRRLVARSTPSRREVRILRGILRRVGHALDRGTPAGRGGPAQRR